jgi:hypothetical protein
MVKTLKEILDQPEPTWLQWRRRLDPMQPFCRIAGHTREEILEILATLETVFQPLLPQLNLRQWTSSIYDWLTHIVLDPASSGRVSMDNLMKLVLAALEWSYEAKAIDVQVEYLEQAAELLVLRHDTFRIIDGEGPSTETDQASGREKEAGSEVSARQIASPNQEQLSPLPPTEPATQTQSQKMEEAQPVATGNCPFSGVVPIALQRFKQSGVSVVECPDCGRAWTLSPGGGVLRFKSHPRRKTNTSNTGRRWVRGEKETDWDVVGS